MNASLASTIRFDSIRFDSLATKKTTSHRFSPVSLDSTSSRRRARASPASSNRPAAGASRRRHRDRKHTRVHTWPTIQLVYGRRLDFSHTDTTHHPHHLPYTTHNFPHHTCSDIRRPSCTTDDRTRRVFRSSPRIRVRSFDRSCVRVDRDDDRLCSLFSRALRVRERRRRGKRRRHRRGRPDRTTTRPNDERARREDDDEERGWW